MSLELLVVIHQRDCRLGRFKHRLDEGDIDYVEVRPAQLNEISPDRDRPDGIISLGGDMSAGDEDLHDLLVPELRFLENAHEIGIPILGVCLGGQLLARALGGTVERKSCCEIGWHEVRIAEDDLVLGSEGSSSRFQWHNDSFTPPVGATTLASGDRCRDQAFRLGRSYGIQFHPEVTLEQVEVWASGRAGTAELEACGIDPDALVAETSLREEKSEVAATEMIEGFLKLCRTEGLDSQAARQRTMAYLLSEFAK